MKKPIVIETFRELSQYGIDALIMKEPSCFNGNVSVKRYRITIEEIEEPNEVIADRLQKLWDDCDNVHHWTPLKNAAKSIGYEFYNNPGQNKKKMNTRDYW